MSLSSSRSRRLRLPFPVLAALCALQGCANAPGMVDPFGQAYGGRDAIQPGPMYCNDKRIDTNPQLVRGNRPPYPEVEKRDYKEARIFIRFDIDVAGKARFLSASGTASRFFHQNAALAVADWKFLPAKKDGVAVSAYCEMGFLYVM